MCRLQSKALRWALGCVNSGPRPEGAMRRDSRNLTSHPVDLYIQYSKHPNHKVMGVGKYVKLSAV